LTKAEAIKNQLAQKANGQAPAKSPESTISALLKRMEPEIKRALPKHITAERMARLALTAIRTNPKLLQCDQMSLLAAVMQSAQLGLEPNTPLGEAYIIPYGREAQFQVGYKGLISLAHRTGEYQSIYAHAVYENDVFEFEYGLNKTLKHIPADDPQGEPVKYYAVYKLQNGGYDFAVASRAQIEKYAQKYSQAYQKGWTSPWKTDFDEMAKKTALKIALKYAPKSIEFAKAITADETVKKELDEDMSSVIDVSNDIVNQEQEKEEQVMAIVE